MEELQIARYDRVFDAYARGDEYLTRDCFSRHVRLLAEIQGKSPDSAEAAAFDQELGNVWDGLAAIADTDHDGRVSRDEWRAAAQGITAGFLAAAEAGGPLPFQEWVGVLYRLIDADGDGRIVQQEYADWLEALGLAADTDIDAAFAGFDKNDDGYLSVEEFAAAYQEYWTDFDPSRPAHRWIGP